MHVLGRNHLVHITQSDRELCDWIKHFLCETLHANWRRESDIFEHFPRSTKNPDGTFAFPIYDGRHLHVAFSFHTATALILGVR
jgi:hypothetical protein